MAQHTHSRILTLAPHIHAYNRLLLPLKRSKTDVPTGLSAQVDKWRWFSTLCSDADNVRFLYGEVTARFETRWHPRHESEAYVCVHAVSFSTRAIRCGLSRTSMFLDLVLQAVSLALVSLPLAQSLR